MFNSNGKLLVHDRKNPEFWFRVKETLSKLKNLLENCNKKYIIFRTNFEQKEIV